MSHHCSDFFLYFFLFFQLQEICTCIQEKHDTDAASQTIVALQPKSMLRSYYPPANKLGRRGVTANMTFFLSLFFTDASTNTKERGRRFFYRRLILYVT